MSTLKQQFNIVFVPKDKRYKKRRVFAISINRLSHYIGKKNAKKVLDICVNSLDEKMRWKSRKYGTLYIYGK